MAKDKHPNPYIEEFLNPTGNMGGIAPPKDKKDKKK